MLELLPEVGRFPREIIFFFFDNSPEEGKYEQDIKSHCVLFSQNSIGCSITNDSLKILVNFSEFLGTTREKKKTNITSVELNISDIK